MGSIAAATTGLLPEKIIIQVKDAIDSTSDELRRISLEIFNNPELIFQEYKACKLLTDWLEARGWTVKREAYGLKTAFEARFSVKSGGRTVCYNAEYDALPEIGHACGHNLIAASSLASAIGVSSVMKTLQIPGTIIVMGTPAEETGGGKWLMAKEGAWKDCDMCVELHGMPGFSTPVCATRASWKLRVKYRGTGAHAAAAPWTGQNACDAIVMAYQGVALLRQQLKKTDSIQSVILEGGKSSNMISDYSEGLFSIRSLNMRSLDELKVRLAPIFDAAAAATGCKVECDWYALYEDVVTNEALAEQYRQYMIQHLGFDPEKLVEIPEAKIKHDQAGSTDFGSCSYITPAIHPMFSINASGMPHSIPFREAAEGEFAHAEAMRAAKANALIGLDVLMNDDFAAKSRSEFRAAMKEAGRL